MIAQCNTLAEPFLARSSATIEADALTRIPTEYFRDMAWAKDSIAACAAMLVDAVGGNHSRVEQWMQNATSCCDAQPLVSVLCAVCDAIVADAFASRDDETTVRAFIASVESELLARLAADRAAATRAAANDPDLAEFIDGFVKMVELHDSATAAHLAATAALARRIAIAMHVSQDRVATIEAAAKLHDIGKIGVRKDILAQSGPLSGADFNEMRRHAQIGAQALLDTPRLAHLAPIVRAHHERIDGFGYPDRLRGEEIPLEARVIAVADAFESMTAEQPYRRSLMPDAALAVLGEHAGTQFDRDVVAATFKLFRYTSRLGRRIA